MQHQQRNQSKDILKGTIKQVICHNPDNGYTVLQVSSTKTPKRLESVFAHLPSAYAGIKMAFHGSWNFQNGTAVFHADFAYELPVNTLTELRKYLRSGIIQGIGPSITKKLVQKFKERTLDILDSDIERLSEVPGISQKRLSKIIDSWHEYQLTQKVMSFLQEHGLTCSYAVRIFKKHGADAINMVKENPYRLIQELDDISFLDVDPVALNMGMAPDSHQRITAAIVHILSANKSFGHCFLTSTQIYGQLKTLLDLDLFEQLPEHLRYIQEQQLVQVRKLPMVGGTIEPCYYEPSVFFDELYVARKISENNLPPEVDLERIKDWVNSYCISELDLSDEQRDGIIGISCEKYSVLTGGPGTGKTAMLKVIARLLESMKLKILLAAPTGRAAQRMTEVTGREAQTIHRLLGWQGDTFKYNENNLLQADFLIVDEASMLDISLTAALLKAVPDTAQILFVGDPDQLPAIGAGNVLKDVINSRAVPVYRLTKIFRQNEDSMIIKFANQIRLGLEPLIQSPVVNPNVWEDGINCLFYESDVPDSDKVQFIKTDKPFHDIKFSKVEHMNFETIDSGLFEFRTQNPVIPYSKNKQSHDEFQKPLISHKPKTSRYIKPSYHSSVNFNCYAAELITKLYMKEIPRHYGNAEIQILSPTTLGPLGTVTLNNVIQEASNPFIQGQRQRQLTVGKKVFRVGDRVIQKCNNYQLGVFNGEIGKIKDIDNSSLTCTVAYPGERLVYYKQNHLMELDLAYAITIHKSQGSEFDIVIIPILAQHYKMLFRSLLYTGITRARKLVVFVGQQAALRVAVKNKNRSIRQTGLKELLRSSVTVS